MRDGIYFRNADGIRGIACLIVLLAHSTGFFHRWLVPHLAGIGKIGVWLFFVLSAFLLTSHLTKSGINRVSIMSYALSRFLRIVPLYVIACIAYYFAGTTRIVTLSDTINAALMLKGYTHLWTIPVEFKFYFFLPIILAASMYVRNRFGEVTSMQLIAIIGLVFASAFPFYLTPNSSVSLWPYIPSFLCGVFAASLFKRHLIKLSGHVRWAINLSIFIGIVLSTNYFRQIAFPNTPDDWLGNKFLFFSLAFSAFLIVNIDAPGAAERIFQYKAIALIGRWSYPIYLFHWMVLAKISATHGDSWLWQAVGLGVTVAVGAIVHYSIELPILSLRNRRNVVTQDVTGGTNSFPS